MQAFTLLICLAQLALACQPTRISDRYRGSDSNRPSETSEDPPGYLDSVENVVSKEAVTIESGTSAIDFPGGFFESDFRVRLSRRVDVPDLPEAASSVLGSPKGDVLLVEVMDQETSLIFPSTNFQRSFEVRQRFNGRNNTANLGMVAVTDPGTSNEKTVLVPNSELLVEDMEISQALVEMREIKVRVAIKATSAIIWFADYQEAALKTLIVSSADRLASIGGGSPQDIRVLEGDQLIEASKFFFGERLAYTNQTILDLRFDAPLASEVYITSVAGCQSGGDWGGLNNRVWELSKRNGVERVYARFKTVHGRESRCMTGSIIHDDTPPSKPKNVLDGDIGSSSENSPMIRWDSVEDLESGIGYYEVAIGTASSTASSLAWSNVGKLTSTSITGLTLTLGETYHAYVRAVDNSGLTSESGRGDGWVVATGQCPNQYVPVPADSSVGVSKDFCVMKYEAKEVGGSAASQAHGFPWRSINRNDAQTKCRAIGSNYDLISNAQWQAIARNIETAQSAPGVYLNWSNSSPNAANIINTGHSDSLPDTVLESVESDAGCIGTGNENCTNNTHLDFSQKRTHVLSNGEVIWDIAGNVFEWVADDNQSPQGVSTYVSQLTSDGGYDLAKWGPAGDYSLKNVSPFGGLGRANLNFSGGAIVRGGWYKSPAAGIYLTDLAFSPNFSDVTLGFRCVYNGISQ